jgi:hypothetical protein
MNFHTCRLCKTDTNNLYRPLFRYSIRHWCHAECGLATWGLEFLRMIPQHQVGQIPYRALEGDEVALKLAQEISSRED